LLQQDRLRNLAGDGDTSSATLPAWLFLAKKPDMREKWRSEQFSVRKFLCFVPKVARALPCT
jgi:hypothetical protein